MFSHVKENLLEIILLFLLTAAIIIAAIVTARSQNHEVTVTTPGVTANWQIPAVGETIGICLSHENDPTVAQDKANWFKNCVLTIQAQLFGVIPASPTGP